MEGKGRRVTRCEVPVVTRGAMSRMVRLVLLLEAFIGLLSVMFCDLYPPHSHRNRHTHVQRKVQSFESRKPGHFVSSLLQVKLGGKHSFPSHKPPYVPTQVLSVSDAVHTLTRDPTEFSLVQQTKGICVRKLLGNS